MDWEGSESSEPYKDEELLKSKFDQLKIQDKKENGRLKFEALIFGINQLT